MSKPKIVVRTVDDRPKVQEFMGRLNPVSASIEFSGSTEIWLLKGSKRGGPTIGRVFITKPDEDVLRMVNECFERKP